MYDAESYLVQIAINRYALGDRSGLAYGDDALSSRLSALIGRLDAHSAHDPALAEILTLLEKDPAAAAGTIEAPRPAATT